MKINLGSANLSLILLASLASTSVGLVSTFPTAVAQEQPSKCPLDQSTAVTFLHSECKAITLKEPRKFYRYYDSNSKYKEGRYLTTNRYDSSFEVIRKLALNQTWGNDAKFIETVTIPAGTTVYLGIAAPQDPSRCYPGGGHQVFIQDSRDPKIIWSEGKAISQVPPFTCQ